MYSISIVAAVNDTGVLEKNLLSSPDFELKEKILERGHKSAAAAYNSGLKRASGDVVIFAHQDLYLPAGWLKNLETSIQFLDGADPNWGVLGVFGSTDEGHRIGHVYSSGIGKSLGEPFSKPQRVMSLDELVLIFRKRSGLLFDERLPGFHLYGADICAIATAQGMRSYVIPAFCVHNSNGIARLPQAYWEAFRYLRKKWFARLPLYTPCMSITKLCIPAMRYQLRSVVARNRLVGKRVPDPAVVFKRLAEAGNMSLNN